MQWCQIISCLFLITPLTAYTHHCSNTYSHHFLRLFRPRSMTTVSPWSLTSIINAFFYFLRIISTWTLTVSKDLTFLHSTFFPFLILCIYSIEFSQPFSFRTAPSNSLSTSFVVLPFAFGSLLGLFVSSQIVRFTLRFFLWISRYLVKEHDSSQPTPCSLFVKTLFTIASKHNFSQIPTF